jgi:carboxyl-terminal processing protease
MNKQNGSNPGFVKLAKGIILTAALLSFFSFSYIEDLFQVSKNLDIFASVYKQLSINYVDDVNASDMMKNGIDAMLEDLDPYTEYIPESDIEDYKLKYVSTQYGGIGATISNRDGKVIVSEPYQGFPAQKADIRAGDELLEIGGISLKGKNNEQVSSLLKGSKGTPVKMLIQRPGASKSTEINLVREDIRQDNVTYFGMLDNNVGYIKLDKFLENSAQEVQEALMELKKNNLNGLVLDLRFNGGGILQEAVKIVNLFVDKGVTVVIQKGRNREKSITYTTINSPEEPDLPLIVLVNSRSASASEIVAGSLQDLDRAVVIGQRSFGKGLVQQTFNLPYNSLVKVTVAKYYTPSGRCIQALDYTHRDSDGTVVKVADSLITEYKTKTGRSVYDGSGIFPDIFVKPLKYSLITQTLASKYHIFDYATQYRNQNPTISDARNFKLSDSEFENFVSFLSKRDYSYNSRIEKLLNEVRDEAKRENTLGEFKIEFEALTARITGAKKNDLALNKDEIKKVLEAEIVSRYYFEKGRLEQNFKYDRDLSESLKVLANKTVLASILNGEGTYKSIGKPGGDFSANTGK